MNNKIYEILNFFNFNYIIIENILYFYVFQFSYWM